MTGAMTPGQAVEIHQRIAELLKTRFPNLSVKEANDMAGNITLMVNELVQQP